MTESELAAHPEFLAFCDIWQRDEWCPYPLIDWFMDRDEERMAEAARWAYEMPERSGYFEDKYKRVFPHTISITYSWLSYDLDETAGYSGPKHDMVPCNEFCPMNRLRFPQSIAWYFVHFDPELAAKYPPSMFESHALTK